MQFSVTDHFFFFFFFLSVLFILHKGKLCSCCILQISYSHRPTMLMVIFCTLLTESLTMYIQHRGQHFFHTTAHTECSYCHNYLLFDITSSGISVLHTILCQILSIPLRWEQKVCLVDRCKYSNNNHKIIKIIYHCK